MAGCSRKSPRACRAGSTSNATPASPPSPTWPARCGARRSPMASMRSGTAACVTRTGRTGTPPTWSRAGWQAAAAMRNIFLFVRIAAKEIDMRLSDETLRSRRNAQRRWLGASVGAAAAQPQPSGMKRTDLQRHDLAPPGARRPGPGRPRPGRGVRHAQPSGRRDHLCHSRARWNIMSKPAAGDGNAGDVLFIPAGVRTRPNVGTVTGQSSPPTSSRRASRFSRSSKRHI